ncbi:GntR family transcriptional regulator [Streptomyces sp. DH12]|uniref:GntR family transcriptional regulator n=1 Tax=Streptomyces sp. DH12 TaxID=2857010 RepID=UPI001E5298AC|nr:GntR family transcriptional regulator [Streptomyces sp. DH12]
MATKSEEIADQLSARIGLGKDYPPGSTLPSFDDLTEEFGVSRLTISRAVELLALRGLVRTVKKAGIIVLRPVERRTVREVVRRTNSGYVFPVAASTSGPWLLHGRPHVGRLPMPDEIADRFGLARGTEALRLRRVSSPPDEPPFQLADTWLHPELLDSVEALTEASTRPGGYLDVIEQTAGHGPLSWERVVRTDRPTAEEAQLLEISRLLPVWRQFTIGISGRTNQPVEVTAAVIPGERIEYATKLRRDGSSRWPVEPIDPAPVSFDVG